MTLEKRLTARLRAWQAESRRLRGALVAPPPHDGPSLRADLARLERCAGELAADLAARNELAEEEVIDIPRFLPDRRTP